MLDEFKHQGKRKQMISLLEQLGISDRNVLEAMNQIPRHFFINSAFEDFAYQNTAFPIEANQTISQPFTVAYQTQLLAVKPNEKILEIGTGSGYQTAVLIALKGLVYTIERQKSLFETAKKTLKQLRFRPKYQIFGDGYLGLPSFAPFDKILITAGSETIPDELLGQLKVGGTLVVPIGGLEFQIMTSFQRTSETEFKKTEHGSYKFVPMLKDTNKENE